MSLVATIPSLVAEMMGSCMLIFIGCTTVIPVIGKANDNLIISFAFAMTTIALIYIFSPVSGSQFNPIITTAFALDGRMSYGSMVLFWMAQLIGALIAGALLLYMFGKSSGLGQTFGVFTTEAPWKAVFIEFVGSFVLVLTILVVTSSPRQCSSAGLIIGLTVFAMILFGYYFSGGNYNPFRSFSGSLFGGDLSTYWIYFLGPFLGAISAFIAYRCFFPRTMSSMLVERTS